MTDNDNQRPTRRTSGPLWEMLAQAGFSDAEIRRSVHFFTRGLNADMVHVVGSNVLYQWEQETEKFLSTREGR
jgi:hypothetical protein